MAKIQIGLSNLRLEDIRAVALDHIPVEIAPSAIPKIKQAHQFLVEKVGSGQTIYGVNTGFGVLSDVRIPEEQIEQLQVNILRSHAAGVGHHMQEAVVRGMLLLRAQSLALGHSGCRLELIKQILKLLNKNVCPVVPMQGSVGASGDLAPLAHLALVLIGEGKARYQGKLMSGEKALQLAKISPISLKMKEGLALINGTQFMSAIGVLTLLDSEHLCDLADLVTAMTLEAVRGTRDAFNDLIHKIRPHPGQRLVARRLRRFLEKSSIGRSHAECGKVQDPYSLRCAPQVHGATRDALSYVRSVLEREVNSVTDNPLVFPESGKVLSGGNFHGQTVAIAMDTLSIAVAELANISEQRIQKLMNPAMSDQPTFLVKNSGINSGFMMVQVAAASIVSENKTLAHPASVDSIPTNVDKEDHVSMGAWAARKAGRILMNSRRVLAMEIMAAAQGVELLRPLQSSKTIEEAIKMIRKHVAFLEDDRPFHDDLNSLESLIADRYFEKLIS